jgi:hypothetical protein
MSNSRKNSRPTIVKNGITYVWQTNATAEGSIGESITAYSDGSVTRTLSRGFGGVSIKFDQAVLGPIMAKPIDRDPTKHQSDVGIYAPVGSKVTKRDAKGRFVKGCFRKAY